MPVDIQILLIEDDIDDIELLNQRPYKALMPLLKRLCNWPPLVPHSLLFDMNYLPFSGFVFAKQMKTIYLAKI